MRTRARSENGETLVEVIFSLVIMGLIFSAFLAAIATSSTASKTHRDLVTADAVLRNAAELTKRAVRHDCRSGPTYSATFPTPPAGFTPPPNISNRACPPVTGSFDTQVPELTFTVTMPEGQTRSLNVRVRTS
jgi:type II secretory pathway pseudopilin PulG